MKKRFFPHYTIKQITFIAATFSAVLLAIFATVVIMERYGNFQNEIEKLRQNYIKSQKELLISETTRAINYIDYKYHKDRDRESLDLMQETIVDAIENMRDESSGTGYIFIYTYDGVNIADPILKQNVGVSLIDFRDSSGKRVIYELINVAKAGGGFVEYMWNRPDATTPSMKLSYAVGYEQFGWVVGSGVHIDEIEKEIAIKEKINREEMYRFIFRTVTIWVLLLIVVYLYYIYISRVVNKDRVKQERFIKNAIHEINTPLSVIVINCDLDKMQRGKNRHITNIESATKILGNIYSDLSYLLERDRVEYKIEGVDIGKFVESRIDFFEEVASGSGVKIEASCQMGLVSKISSIELQRIVDNTISNAIKYSFAKSTIFITVKKVEKGVEFSVKNSAKNIENIDKIFDRYYRESSVKGGFGVGLSIIAEICDKYSIKKSVISKDNSTTFSYIFRKETGEDTSA